MNFTYKKADTIIAVSRLIKKSLEENFNIQPEKIKTIYNPVSFKEIKIKSEKVVTYPFLKYENTRVFISVGRLVEQKRFDRLL